MRNTAAVTGGKTIAVSAQSFSGLSVINPLVAFYDIHGRKREVQFFYSVADTARAARLLNSIVEKQLILNTVYCNSFLKFALVNYNHGSYFQIN
jgi:hypothetical protein